MTSNIIFLEKIFKFNAIFLVILFVIGLISTLHLYGIEGLFTSSWSSQQSNIFYMGMLPDLVVDFIYLAIAFFSVKKKVFTFFVVILVLIFQLQVAVQAIAQIAGSSFSWFDLLSGLNGFFVILAFIVSLIGMFVSLNINKRKQ